MLLALAVGPTTPLWAQTATPPPSIVRKLQSTNERMEMTVNTSRILTLDHKIPQAQVNNPDILQLTPLSPNQIQMSAKKAGVTQVNLWDENKRIYTIDVIVLGDARELTELLHSRFPNASLKVIPVGNSVLISGTVDHPGHVCLIVRIAEEYYPKVINNITVSGVQQVLLHVKVMEVSRTKLRALGFDWTQLSGNNIVASGVSGLLGAVVPGADGVAPAATATGGTNFSFSVIQGSNAFFGVLEALRQDNLLKILAEPTLVTVSGRPASFNVGGEIPVLVPQSLGTVSIEYKKYGTQLDFIPIVLGNGRIRLEVRPRVSEIDPANSIVLQGITVPGLRTREVETGVELRASQTLAIAGLVQTRVESQRRGMPIVSEVPYLGALFRRVEERNNEIELLMLVTPEIVDAMDPHEVPPCGPGTRTTSPGDHELYFKGHIEVPRCCPMGVDPNCPECVQQGAVLMDAPMDTPVAVPAEGGLPGMILRPEAEKIETPKPRGPAIKSRGPAPESRGPAIKPPKPAPESVLRAKPSRSRPPLRDAVAGTDRHNPVNRQIAHQVPRSNAKKSLPGFMGKVGYDVVK